MGTLSKERLRLKTFDSGSLRLAIFLIFSLMRYFFAPKMEGLKYRKIIKIWRELPPEIHGSVANQQTPDMIHRMNETKPTQTT